MSATSPSASGYRALSKYSGYGITQTTKKSVTSLSVAELVEANEENKKMKGYTYILLCSNGQYYTGSTTDLDRRVAQHQAGEGANFTRKYRPVKLVYFEEFPRIDQAFYREKQIQGWSRKKKEALINGEFDKLPELSKNYSQNKKSTD